MEAYLGLFLTAFLAATLLPGFSEVLFAGLLASGYDPLALWTWATAGNSLGAAVNWLFGRYLLRFRDRRWFPFDPYNLGRAQRWFQRYGVWSLLIAWAPVIGDALTFVAGLMRVRFGLFILLTAIGKGARYAILLGLIEGVGTLVENGPSDAANFGNLTPKDTEPLLTRDLVPLRSRSWS